MAGIYKRSQCQTCRVRLWTNNNESTSVQCGRCKLGLPPLEGAAECGICLEYIEDRIPFKVVSNHSWSQKRCSHLRSFCRGCLRGHVASRLTETSWNIRCPFVGDKGERCPYIMMEADLQSVLNKPEDASLLSQYEELRMADHGDHLRAILSSQKSDPDSDTTLDSDSTHSASDSGTDSEGSGFELWAGNSCQACPRCLVVVRKDTGCDHMVCRCGTEFCFRCGGPYSRSVGPECICKAMPDVVGDHRARLGFWLHYYGRLDSNKPVDQSRSAKPVDQSRSADPMLVEGILQNLGRP